MPAFAIRNPYLIVVVCLIIAVVGVAMVARMPVDLFPTINNPEVVVATLYSGMPPEHIETDITGRFERFFTMGSGIDHMESRSLPGVSIIKVFFQPETDPDADAAMISNLALANLRRLPPGTLPPIVLKFDASSMPVAMVALKGEGLSETQLRDLGQFNVRNQIANVPGATIPPPFGGKYRQIMIYADPLKLQARQLSLMDVVRAVNESNLILPAGDVKIGSIDYNIYTNSQIASVADINRLPLKTVGHAPVTVGDIGWAEDGNQIQYSVVRVDGQRSVYLPVMRQGGNTNTIAVVDGLRAALGRLVDVPKELGARVVFDQSVFIKRAIETLLREGGISLLFTGIMILIFLGSMRATLAVFLSIPLSALATFVVLYFGGSSINTMILGGLALAFSRLIDNSVIVLENIFHHLEKGEPPEVAATRGGEEVQLAVLAATLSTAVVFFPVIFLYGVSKFLFSAMALAVVLSLFASYLVALTVVPLYCSKLLLKAEKQSHSGAFYHGMLRKYEEWAGIALQKPVAVVLGLTGIFCFSLTLYRSLDVAFFPRTDAGQFMINLKAPSGTRLEATEARVKKVEEIVRQAVDPKDLDVLASNTGVTPGFSAIYTSNSASHTAFVQVSLKEGHGTATYEYVNRIRRRLQEELPDTSFFFQSGAIVDAVLNQGLPAPIDIQVTGSNLDRIYETAAGLAAQIRQLPDLSDVFIPQDLDYPSLRLDIDRLRAGELGISEHEAVANVITALASNAMIAPSYWVDPKNGNDYLLTVQYPESQVQNLLDLKAIPIRSPGAQRTTSLDAIAEVKREQAPTEVDHYQIRRVIDIYVTPSGEDLGRALAGVNRILARTAMPPGVRAETRGLAQAMNASFRSFGLGLMLSLVLLYLILVAQFRSFVDPLLILLAVPMGLAGVLATLLITGTSLNVQSLMGLIMMAGIVVSNSILIVEFAHRMEESGLSTKEAVISACRVRLRPILMTSLATIIGLIPMAMKMGTGSEAYAPLARVIIGGLTASVVLTVFIVPAAYLLVHDRREAA